MTHVSWQMDGEVENGMEGKQIASSTVAAAGVRFCPTPSNRQPSHSSKDFRLVVAEPNNHLYESHDPLTPNDNRNYCRQCVESVFSKKTLYKRLPILQWLPNYSRADAVGDLIAGITVGLTIIPQGLAYSNVAGLPTQFGLYGSFMGCFVYVLLGTCKDSTVGSTAIASLLTFQVAKGVWQKAILLTFLTGIIEIFMAIFHLGFLVDFVSGPVSAGFTSAVALIVTTSQVKNILGVQSKGSSFLQRWISMIGDMHNIQVYDAILGSCCVVILIILRTVGRCQIGPKDSQAQRRHHRLINKTLWLVGVMRNAALVITCALISIHLESQGKHYFKLTGNVPEGLPSFALPPFSIPAQTANATLNIESKEGETFLTMVQSLGYGLIIVPMIAMLENISVCKAFAKGKPVDATQELFAIGVANVANSFFQGYRSNSGLARSAVNNASGVRTPLANFYIGLVVMLALLYLTRYFYFIPLTVLGAIIISAVIFQVQYQVIKPMWRSKRSDLVPAFTSFFACLIMPLELGILAAIGVNFCFILYQTARPKVTLQTAESLNGRQFLQITPDRCLIFPSVEFVRNLILKSGNKTNLPVVLDCTYIYGADYTAAKVITSIVEDFNRRHQQIIFYNLKPSVAQVFKGVNPQLIVCYNAESLTEELSKPMNSMNLPLAIIEDQLKNHPMTSSNVILTKYQMNNP